MAGYSSAIDLQLPAVPDSAVDPKLALAILPLHYAMHSLHKGASQATGAWMPDQAQWPTITPAMSILTGNHRKIYKIAAVAINVGQLVRVDATGKMALALATTAATLAVGWATRAVAAGAVGEFIMFEGLLAVTGVVAGTVYYLSNTPGAVQAVAGTVAQKVGVGIEANLLYMRIAL